MGNKTLGLLIRKLRKDKGLSLRKLAEKVDISFVNIAHIENGRVATSEKIIKQLAKALDYDVDKLLAVADSQQHTKKDLHVVLIRLFPTHYHILQAYQNLHKTKRQLNNLLLIDLTYHHEG